MNGLGAGLGVAERLAEELLAGREVVWRGDDEGREVVWRGDDEGREVVWRGDDDGRETWVVRGFTDRVGTAAGRRGEGVMVLLVLVFLVLVFLVLVFLVLVLLVLVVV